MMSIVPMPLVARRNTSHGCIFFKYGYGAVYVLKAVETMQYGYRLQ